MGILRRFLSGDLQASTPAPDADFWYRPVGLMTPAGMRVDAEGAQKISAWYRGRDILATVLAMLPLPVYERLPNDGGANVAREHPLYDMLHDKPNSWQDSFQWRRQAMYHLIDHGNAYNRMVPGRRGFVDQLHPIHPTLVMPEQLPTGRVVYRIRDPKTQITSSSPQSEVFHLRGASDDGVVGKGILDAARTSLGTALATESYAAQIFSRGTLTGGHIEIPGELDPDASKRMAETFVTAAGNWHLPKVLEQGAKFVPSEMSPEDFQMLLSRKFSIDDMARWLGVPRQMLENNDPSFGNAEQFDRNFIAYSMGPWLALWEFAIRDQLIIDSRKYYAQFTRQAIVRGDLAVRWNAHVAAVNAGIVTVDEVRDLEDLNKRGGKADELREPQNITGKPTAAEGQTEPIRSRRRIAPPDDGSERDGARAEAIAIEVAARLLRKEVAAIQKLAVRHAGDEEAFVVAVTAFYQKHIALVEQALQVSHERAEAYCAEQAHQILNQDWLAALQKWRTTDYAAGLAGLALESEAA